MGIQTRLWGPCPGGAEGLQHHSVCGPSQQVGAEGRGGLGPPPKLETQEERGARGDVSRTVQAGVLHGYRIPGWTERWGWSEPWSALLGWGRAEPPAAGDPGEQGPCLKLGGGGGAAFSLLSARRPPESPLDVARMTQLPQAAKAR